jgi:hypothetical protein
MNGNITQDGITRDLEWMKRIGIGGFQNFDAALGTPQIVKERLVFMTPPWRDAFKHAAQTADRLGLEMSIAGSPGWSESGGPGSARAGHEEAGLEETLWSAASASMRACGAAANRGDTGPAAGCRITADEGAPAPTSTGMLQSSPLRYACGCHAAGAAVTSSAGPVDAAQLGDGHLAGGVPQTVRQPGCNGIWGARSVRAFTLAFGGTPQLDFLIDTTRLQANAATPTAELSHRAPRDSAISQRTGFAPVTGVTFDCSCRHHGRSDAH